MSSKAKCLNYIVQIHHPNVYENQPWNYRKKQFTPSKCNGVTLNSISNKNS